MVILKVRLTSVANRGIPESSTHARQEVHHTIITKSAGYLHGICMTRRWTRGRAWSTSRPFQRLLFQSSKLLSFIPVGPEDPVPGNRFAEMKSQVATQLFTVSPYPLRKFKVKSFGRMDLNSVFICLLCRRGKF